MAAGPEKAGPRRPRVLVTGFGPFPGAPENPTADLVRALAGIEDRFSGICAFRAETFAVDYRALPDRLDELGKAFRPDIAIHFGLSSDATGFRLERVAKNAIAEGKPDNAGFLPQERQICAGEGELSSSLPLDAIFARLEDLGLPVSVSNDAGGYLCNYLFYFSRGHLRQSFAPAMSGFIHVPPVGAEAGVMTLADLTAGSVAIIETCCRAWAARPASAAV